MGTIDTFDHTADVGLRIRASDLSELFQTAAEGTFDYIVVNRDQVRAECREDICLRAETPAELLVSWLNELIYRSETQHRLYSRFAVEVAADGQSLKAAISGEPIDRNRHLLDHEVKAATHHGLTLGREGEQWVAEVILDI